MSVAKVQVAEAEELAEAVIEGEVATLAPHLVARANEAHKASEALRILKKRVETEKEFFDGVLARTGVSELRNASGRTVVRLNYRAPIVLNQARVREEYPKVAEACTEPNPYTFVDFP